MRHVYRRFAPVRKVVVVDCDNTLWRGVVGEVGPEGLEFDAGHRALHTALTTLAGSGVLVCLCSKNEEADVWRVFEARPDFGLRREHVVAGMINWLPKSQNLRTLAGPPQSRSRQLRVPRRQPGGVRRSPRRVPGGAHDPVAAGRRTGRAAARPSVGVRSGQDDEGRRAPTALYKEEFRRQEARAETLTFEDFIKSLGLEVDFAPMAADDLRRSAQLTLRTNQFNFTTIRREESELQALAADGRHEIRTVRVRDRFGDYGLVGLVIAERGDDAWSLDTFLLSCRVLGRGVEHQIVADLGQMAPRPARARSSCASRPPRRTRRRGRSRVDHSRVAPPRAMRAASSQTSRPAFLRVFGSSRPRPAK
jgi:HAD superfamily phosphatase (TIGR01681 family)